MIRRTLKAAMLVALSASMIVPSFGFGTPQHSNGSVQHRKQTRDEWRNLSIASGAAAILGLVARNGTLTLLGTAGALYSAYRYEEDRKSANKMDRERAALYSHRYVKINGKKYKRRVVVRHGTKYFQFVRA